MSKPSPYLFVAFLLFWWFASFASAVTFRVNTTTDDYQGVGGNELCSLREAINSANENRDIGGCERVRTGSYGDDTVRDIIILEGGKTYRLTRTDDVLFEQDADDLDALRGKLRITTSSGQATIEAARFKTGTATIHFRALEVHASVDVELQNLIFKRTSNGLGGIHNRGKLLIERSLITGNASLGNGGGIRQTGSGSSLILRSSTVSKNEAGLGGGLYIEAGTARLENATIVDNMVGATPDNVRNLYREGGAIDVRSPARVEVVNSIIFANLSFFPDFYTSGCLGEIKFSGNNHLQDCPAGTSDFRFSGSLSDDSGLAIPDVNGSFARGILALGIDAATCASGLDQLGNARNIDGDGDGLALCDIGAIEAVEAKADLSVSANSPVNVAQNGSSYELRITVRNSGTHTARNIKVNLSYPAERVSLSRSGCGPFRTGFACDLEFLRPAEEVTYTFNITAPLTGTLDTVPVSILSTTFDPIASNNSLQFSIPVAPAVAGLSMFITSSTGSLLSNFAVVGQTADYTLNISNAGPGNSGIISVLVPLPTGTTFAATDSSRNCRLRTINLIICTLPSLSTSQRTSVRVVLQMPSAPTTFRFSASVSAQSPDPNPSNNTALMNTEVVPSVTDLAITMRVPAQIAAGSLFPFIADLRNLGPDTAFNSTLTVTLPVGFSYSSQLNPGKDCTLASLTVLRCRLGSLRRIEGGFSTQTITLLAPSTTASGLLFSGSIGTDSADTVTSNNSSGATTSVVAKVSTAADVSVSLDAPKETFTTFQYTYAANVINTSVVSSTVQLALSLPSGVSVVSIPTGCSRSSNTMTCSSFSLSPGGSRVFEVAVTAPSSPATLSASVRVNSSVTDPVSSNNSTTVSTTVLQRPAGANLALNITAPDKSQPGKTLKYTLKVKNNGPDTAPNTFLNTTLPEGVSVVSKDADCTLEEALLWCALGDLAVSEEKTIAFSLKAPATAQLLSLYGAVFSSRIEWEPTDNTALAVTNVGGISSGFSTTLGQKNPADQNVKVGASDVTALQLALSSTAQGVVLEGLGLRAEGSGHDQKDIVAVKVVLDSNVNGRVDPSELVLKTGVFPADNANLELTLETPLEVAANQTLHVVVAVDFNSNLAFLAVPVIALAAMLRGRVRYVLLLAVLLTACATNPPQQSRDYTLSLTSLKAKTSLTQEAITVDGLPLKGSSLRILK